MLMPLSKLKPLWLLGSHSLVLTLGFMLGVYMLPIIIQPQAPPTDRLEQQSRSALYQAKLNKELADSDSLHWAEGRIFLAENHISFIGELAPGPDYKIYLTPKFVQTEKDFLAVKNQALYLGDINTFNNFEIDLHQSPNYQNYNSLVIWCETFEQFISAAKYRSN